MLKFIAYCINSIEIKYNLNNKYVEIKDISWELIKHVKKRNSCWSVELCDIISVEMRFNRMRVMMVN